jgi:hypothetical protein
MSATPAGIAEADWLATPPAVQAFILVQQAELEAQQQEIEKLRSQLTALATELLPIERVDQVVEHHPDACRHCGTLLEGQDPDPLRHQVIEIPPIT